MILITKLYNYSAFTFLLRELQERVEELEKDVSDKYDKVQHLDSQFGLAKAECRGLQAEMSVINQVK